MTYHNAIKFIKNAPNISPCESSVFDRMSTLFGALGNPQKRIKYIRLAGSNGKTLCAGMLVSILNSAKISNGCLSMPIHADIRDNVLIDGNPIGMDDIVKYVTTVRDAVTEINKSKTDSQTGVFMPTVHEILLCIALLAFTEHMCKICIIESDHNGEDPSKILPAPLAAVICGSIPCEDKDKRDIYKIRSYICRGMREIISAPQNTDAYKIIADTCSNVNCRLTLASKNNVSITRLTLRGTEFKYKNSDYSLRICGNFQVINALVAIESAEMLTRLGYPIKKSDIHRGLATVSAPCKFEILSLSPVIIADSTYTPIAIEAVCDSLSDFKSITGSSVRLCLPYGELITQYTDALSKRGYTIENIFSLRSDGSAENNPICHAHVNIFSNVKSTAKSVIAGLDKNTVLLISGPINFTRPLRYELLGIMGLGGI